MAGLALLAGLAACSARKESPEQYEVVAAVRRYNEALPRAYAQAASGVLAAAATNDEIQRVDDLIRFLAQGRMVMDARQESFEAGPVSFPEAGKAQLEATEVWWYRHWKPETGEVKQPPRRVRYTNRYQLVRVGDRWLVDRLVETGWQEIE